MRPYLIGIAGPSCSGKSEVSRRLARILRAPVVAIDHYYKDLGHLTIAERSRTNFDAPESLDRELVLKHVEALRAGHVVEQPTYDFAHHTRAVAVERIEPCEYILIEVCLPFRGLRFGTALIFGCSLAPIMRPA